MAKRHIYDDTGEAKRTVSTRNISQQYWSIVVEKKQQHASVIHDLFRFIVVFLLSSIASTLVMVVVVDVLLYTANDEPAKIPLRSSMVFS
jgi:hypothetical protein